jgi:hypothetical protein
MSEPSITDEEVDDLCEQLNSLELSSAQRSLLDGILKMAWDATAAEEALEAGFDGCFEPSQAALLISYHGAPATTAFMVSRAVGGSTLSSTHMVSRMVSRHTDP